MVLLVEGQQLVNDCVLDTLLNGGRAPLPGGLDGSWAGGPSVMLRALRGRKGRVRGYEGVVE